MAILFFGTPILAGTELYGNKKIHKKLHRAGLSQNERAPVRCRLPGSLDKQGTVTVAGNAATVNHFTTNFMGYTSVTNGTNVIPIVAKDYGNHARPTITSL